MKAKVGTLLGHTSNAVLGIDILLGNYFMAKKSSSCIIPSEIVSFTYDVHSAKSISSMRSAIIASINSLFVRHFDSHNVSVEITEVDGRHDITIGVSVTDDGIEYGITRLVGIDDTSVTKISNILDKGL